MDWRRGLLFAGIHLVVAAPMVLLVEAANLRYMEDRNADAMEAARDAAALPPVTEPATIASADAEENGETVTFSPCGLWAEYPPEVVVVQLVDAPALVFSGWEMDCPARWSLAGRLRGNRSWPPDSAWMAAEYKIGAGLCAMIAVQWFLLGGFRLARRPEWWRDPATFLTACAIVAGILGLLPGVDLAARLPALVAGLCWYWWFGLLVWRALSGGWRWVLRLRAVPAQ